MSGRLLKLKSDNVNAFLTEIRGKKICHIVRQRLCKKVEPVNIPVDYLRWTGTTENEFFVVIFYAGLLTISIAEREMFLGENTTPIAVSKYLKELAEPLHSISDGMEFSSKLQIEIDYLRTHYNDDLENLRFKHLMPIIKWKFVSRKIKEDEFCMEH